MKPTYAERMRARALAANERKRRRDIKRIDKWYTRQFTQEERETRADRFKVHLEPVRGGIPRGEALSVAGILAAMFTRRRKAADE